MAGTSVCSLCAVFLLVVTAQRPAVTAAPRDGAVVAIDNVNVVTNLTLAPEKRFISASWTLENTDWTVQTFEVSYAEEGGQTTTCSVGYGAATNTDICLTTAGQQPVLSPCTAYTVTVTPQKQDGTTNGVPASNAACTTGCEENTCSVPTTTTTTQPTTTTTTQPTTTTTTIPMTTTTTTTQPATTTTQPTITTTIQPTTTTTQLTTTKTTQPTTTTTTIPMTTTTTTTQPATTTTQPTITTTIQPTTTTTQLTTTKTTQPTKTSTQLSTTQPTTTTTSAPGGKPGMDTLDTVLVSLIGVLALLNMAVLATFYVNWNAVLKRLGLRSPRKMPT